MLWVVELIYWCGRKKEHFVPVFSGVWVLIAGLSGFASYWHSLHLGAGCEQWKLQDVSGNQPPLSITVVNVIVLCAMFIIVMAFHYCYR